MAIGVGCMGMSMDDFERCTPAEFERIYARWREQRTNEERSRWERTRSVCMFVLQPWSKKPLKAKDVLPLPWDNKTAPEDEEEMMSEEERRKRYEDAKRRYGLR